MSCKLELRSSCPFASLLKTTDDYYKLCGLCIKAVYAKARLEEAKKRIIVVNTL